MFLYGRDGIYWCGKSGHRMKEYPKEKANVREGKQVSTDKVDDGQEN